MFTITRNGTNRLDIELSGKLNKNDMKVALDDLVNKSEGISKGKILYDVINFHIPSIGAISIELSRLPKMLNLMKRFDRVAVLTDQTWLKKASEWEGTFFPGMVIKAFDRNQRSEAENWLSR